MNLILAGKKGEQIVYLSTCYNVSIIKRVNGLLTSLNKHFNNFDELESYCDKVFITEKEFNKNTARIKLKELKI
jgi:hypothetical protein